MTTNRAVVALLLVLVGASCEECVCNPPGARITSDSRTEECRQDLMNALNTFVEREGLNFRPSPEDADAVFLKGEVSKSYGRDGVHYNCHFGLKQTPDGCSLKFWKREMQQPGESTTTFGHYGSVKLNVCKCTKSE